MRAVSSGIVRCTGQHCFGTQVPQATLQTQATTRYVDSTGGLDWIGLILSVALVSHPAACASDSLQEHQQAVVLIEPLATIGAIEDFLYPHVQQMEERVSDASGSPSSVETPSGTPSSADKKKSKKRYTPSAALSRARKGYGAFVGALPLCLCLSLIATDMLLMGQIFLWPLQRIAIDLCLG
jgi:hypothetical protein